MPTTYKAVRDKQREVIDALEPTLLPTLGRFTEWKDPSGPSFEQWAMAAVDPFRVYWLRHGLDYSDEKYLDEQTESVVHTQLLLVAYPRLERIAGERMDDVIDQDITDLVAAIGTRGYGDYSALGAGQHAAMRIGTAVERRPNVLIVSIQFQLDYDRRIT